MSYTKDQALNQAERIKNVVDSIIVNVVRIKSGIISCEKLLYEKYIACYEYLCQFEINLNTKLLRHLDFLQRNSKDEEVLNVCIICEASIKMLDVYFGDLFSIMRGQRLDYRWQDDENVLILCRETEASMKETVEWINGMWESLSLKKDGVLDLTPLSLPVKSYVPPRV